MNEYLERFLKYLIAERNASEHTISSYKRDLDQFRDFLGPNPSTHAIAQLQHFDIRRFLGELQKNHMSVRP